MSSGATGRPSTGTSSATVERSASSSCCTSSSGTSGSIAPTSSVVQSGSSGFAGTGNVALNSQSLSSAVGSSNSYSGCAIGRTRVRAAAFQNQPPMWLSIASVIRRSLPTFCTSTWRGTLPLRKPGILAVCARSDAACSTAWCMSCDGTCTVRRTRFSGSSSTWACTRPFKQTPSGLGRSAERAALRADPSRAFDAQRGKPGERRPDGVRSSDRRKDAPRRTSSGISWPRSRSSSASTRGSGERGRPRTRRCADATCRASKSRCSTTSTSATSKARRSTSTARGSASTRAATRSPAARASTTRRDATPTRSSGCSRAPEQTLLVVCHEIPVRYALNAAAGSDDLDGPEHAIPNATPYLFDEPALARAASRIRALAG